ncbi:ATP-binding protein [Mycobacterium sp. NPDC051804]|uniref:ATP-binding protein n=1 Tax=Mycobacterium sp. NPDC051804 TaxID=3364295 RepID=UPI0037949080
MFAGDPPTGVVTFLFTDIEGSTRRWESDADAMRSALVAHDKVLRSAIEAHEGYVFSHSGDGMAAAFASPMAAVDTAVDAQRELQLPVRMGIATGEAELRDNDYFGTVLNRAARVMAAGHGGQILVADSTAGLLSGLDLSNLGPRRLRDLPNPVTISQLVAPGLRADFPPLRTVDTTRGNLRRSPEELIGRESAVAEIVDAMRSHRLVTLAGVGGVGKTRLAFKVAARLSDEFPDGVWVFELASLSDPAAVPDAVAATMGITQQPCMTVGQSVSVALDGRIRLLVFDNCEHVVESAADLIEAILEQSSTVKVLTTSREGLGVAEERLWRVPSLDIGSAATLFAARARCLSADESLAAEEVCRRLDGIPLAIELAASRLESMTAVEVRDHLDQRFKLLVRSRRGLARHQTLRHAVAWSYDLLDDSEKTLLERCSVFAGGFEARSAYAVAGADDEYVVLDLLDALVRKSLLGADRSTGRTRFSMLETIRQFAEEKLVERGQAADASFAHAHHFASRENEVLKLWDSPRQREAYEWAATEFANLRKAFRWAIDQGDLDVAAAVTTYVGLLGFGAENFEPLAWAEELIDCARLAEHPRCLSVYAVASVCWMAGRTDAAVRYADIAGSLLASSQHPPPFAMEGWIGSAYVAVGQPRRWAELCTAQLARRGDNHVYIRACRVFAHVFSGDLVEAAAGAHGLIESGVATNNPYMQSFAVGAASHVLIVSAGIAQGLDDCRKGLALAQDSGNRFNESILALNLARLEAHDFISAASLDHLTLVTRNYHDSGNVASLRSPLAALSSFLDRLGNLEAAAIISGYALTPLAMAAVPEVLTAVAHLRDTLGDETFESLALTGEAMSMAEITAYAYEQIAEARAELERSP